MTLLLIIAAWFLLLSLVVGLCLAASVGDSLQTREPGSGVLPEVAVARAEDRTSRPRPTERMHAGHIAA